MGAESFISRSDLTYVEKAFEDCVDRAQFDFGHSGYTGTIAEKESYIVIQSTPLPWPEAEALAEKLIENDDDRISDKWGPAGAIPLSPKGWLFFGWASS